MVEAGREAAGDCEQVLVAPVAGSAGDDDAACPGTGGLVGGERVHELAHRADGGGVVAVVEDDLEAELVVDVAAAGRLEEGCVEGAEALADVLEAHAHRPGHRRREHGVLHVVHRLAFEGGGDEVRPQERHVGAVVVHRDHLPVQAGFQGHGAPACPDVFAHQRIVGPHGDPADVSRHRLVRHVQAEGVVSVEHDGVARDLDGNALDRGQLFEGVHPAQPEVVGRDVEAARHVGMPIA